MFLYDRYNAPTTTTNAVTGISTTVYDQNIASDYEITWADYKDWFHFGTTSPANGKECVPDGTSTAIAYSYKDSDINLVVGAGS